MIGWERGASLFRERAARAETIVAEAFTHVGTTVSTALARVSRGEAADARVKTVPAAQDKAFDGATAVRVDDVEVWRGWWECVGPNRWEWRETVSADWLRSRLARREAVAS